jgi:hypothetical protein
MIFTTEQLTAMKAAQSSHMNDTVDIINRTPFYSNGETLYTQVVQSGVACGFDFTGGKEIDKGQVIITDYNADMRVPLGTEISINDWVILRTLAGETHDEAFEVIEEPRFGTTALHVNLKQLDDGVVITPISAIAPQGDISDRTPTFEWDDDSGNFTDYYLEVYLVSTGATVIAHWFGPNTGGTNYEIQGTASHKIVEFPYLFSINTPYSWRWLGWSTPYGYGLWSDYYYFERVA